MLLSFPVIELSWSALGKLKKSSSCWAWCKLPSTFCSTAIKWDSDLCKKPCSPSTNTLSIHTLCWDSQQYYAHIYSLLQLLWSRVFILPTVKLSMDGWKLNWSWRAGGREVEWYVEQMCKCRRTEKQFIFYSLPWMLRITVWRVSNKPWSNFVFRDKRCASRLKTAVKTEGSMTTADKLSSTEKGKHDKLFKLHEQ